MSLKLHLAPIELVIKGYKGGVAWPLHSIGVVLCFAPETSEMFKIGPVS